MELLSKMVQTLPENQFEALLAAVGVNKNHKNYVTLECLREGYELERINNLLGISKGAFTTHKSRLLKKVSEHIGKLEENPVTLLKEETARISHIAMQHEREVALRILFDIEIKLKEYDLANELSIVYKLLARLHRFYPEYEHYEMQYKKYVAFALALTKAEDLLYGFTFNLSHYNLNHEKQFKESILQQLNELKSFSSLYPSHRLFVIYNIANIYYDCCFLNSDELAKKEIDVEDILTRFTSIFETYRVDSFYQNISQLVPFLFFEYYVKVGNAVKAQFFLSQIIKVLPSVAHRQLWPFFITQMVNSIVTRFVSNAHIAQIIETQNCLTKHYHPSSNETPHYISHMRFKAIAFFYGKNYRASAKTVNTLRNTITLKDFYEVDIEMKLFQSFQYALLDEPELAERLLSSSKRMVTDNASLKPIVKIFGKVVSLLIKHNKTGKEKDSIIRYWKKFKDLNQGRILFYIRLSQISI